MKKIRSVFKLIIGIIVFIYFILNSNIINDIKANIKEASKGINEVQSVVKQDFNGEVEVQFIDVGQADAILIRQSNYNMLIDAGNNEDGEKLVNYFKSIGITSFDYAIVTHAHEDHIGGMDDIINNFKVENFYMPDVLTTTKTFEDVLNALEENNMLYSVFNENDTFNLGDILFDVIYIGDEKNDLNDTSIILKLIYGDTSFLFTGDATSKVEKQILNKNIKSDVLKVAHHGSDYSTTDEFLKKVSPLYAVISVGKNNSYKHPSSSVLKKLNDMGVNVYRTDEKGTVIFKTNGKDINVNTIKTDTNG